MRLYRASSILTRPCTTPCNHRPGARHTAAAAAEQAGGRARMMASRFTPAGPSPSRKLVMAASPRMRRAAASYASAASSAVSNVPSHRREPCGVVT